MAWGRLDQAAGLAAGNRNTVLVIDHLGLQQPFQPPPPAQPWADLPKVLSLASHPNVSMKISGACTLSHEKFPYKNIWDPIIRIIDAFGLDRCMWGTDWTRATALLTYDQGVEAFRVTNRLSDSDRAALMGDTLQKIYNWSPSKRKLLTIALACGLAASWSAMAAENYLDLSSRDFEDGGKLPMKYDGNNPKNPNCTGENISPALDWKNPPAGTKSFTIILFDTARRAPLGVVHWFAYGLPPTKMGFKEGEAAQPPEFGVQGPELETHRGLANVSAIWGVWLDNDGGGLAPAEFAALFPGLEMVIYNTHSSTNDATRYRVLIPTTAPLTIDVHTEIVQQIRKSLNKRGYFDRKQLEKRASSGREGKPHGSDHSKFGAASMFYLPAQAAAGPDHSFFYALQGDKRMPIYPYQWIAKTVINHTPEPEPTSPTPERSVALARKDPKLTQFLEMMASETHHRCFPDFEHQIEQAIQRWRSHPHASPHSVSIISD